MRILGIDPGLNTTGFGIVDVDGHALRYVASGTISTRSVTSGSLPQRLKVLFDGIAEINPRSSGASRRATTRPRRRWPRRCASTGARCCWRSGCAPARA